MTPVRPGRAPLATAGASYLAVLIALLVIAVGVVGLRDGVIAAGWIGGTPWTPVAVDWLAALRPGGWMLPVGAVLAIAGLACVVTSIKPRRKPTAEVAAATAVFINLSDTARVATAAAESVAGVVAARSTARRGAVVVRCEVTGPLSADQRHAVEAAVGGELDALRAAPKIVVRTRTVANR